MSSLSASTKLVASLRELSKEMEDSRVVKKILRVVPKKSDRSRWRLRCSRISTPCSWRVSLVVGRLRVAETANVEDVANGIERLLLTEG
jgi:hypothetical protein